MPLDLKPGQRIEPKNLTVHVMQKDRIILLEVINPKTGKQENLVGMTVDQAANMARQFFEACQVARRGGASILLPGDPSYKPPGS